MKHIFGQSLINGALVFWWKAAGLLSGRLCTVPWKMQHGAGHSSIVMFKSPHWCSQNITGLDLLIFEYLLQSLSADIIRFVFMNSPLVLVASKSSGCFNSVIDQVRWQISANFLGCPSVCKSKKKNHQTHSANGIKPDFLRMLNI